MSYNKPEKEFGEAPKVHKIRTRPRTVHDIEPPTNNPPQASP
jgi:hypothetical protein